MASSPVALHAGTPAELKARLEAERLGEPFLVYRDGADRQQIRGLTEGARLTIGRRSSCDLWLDWDEEVSRLHAQLEPVGDEWMLVDDGLSRNGSFVNGERVAGRRRLEDGDVLRLGETALAYRDPREGHSKATVVRAEQLESASLSEAQRRVLVALCRPFGHGSAFASPASNQGISEELVLSVDAVKTHLRALYAKFGIEDLPQNEKRLRLVELAFQSGLITERDLKPQRRRATS